jgi:hypothetical protein
MAVVLAILGASGCFFVGSQNPTPVDPRAYAYFLLPTATTFPTPSLANTDSVDTGGRFMGLYVFLPWSVLIPYFFGPTLLFTSNA